MEQRVAITGIGAVSPLGNTALATWAAMCAGTCGIGPITHFDTDAFAVKVAAEVKGFDGNEYFGKRDAKHLDPCVQFAMAASDEAMHDAGFDVEGAIDRERLGVYVGSGVGGMTTLVDNVHTIAERGPRRASPYMIAMMIPNMASGNIAIRHKAKGPTLPVVTACATSAHAVGEAFRAIKHGYADAILAGGAEAAIIPDAVAGFTSCRALTTNPDPATACRPFDADRDGFVMGEGACVLVLESMEHAQARGAHIYAEVVGYGNTDDAYHITSPDPEAAGIARAISLAVTEGDVKPSEGLYINAHGTSTKLNDSSETAGIKRALGEDAARAAHVSSTKSMTGHMIGATGAIEVMACAMAIEQGVVPPTINYRTPDPACDLDYTPNRAVRADLTWALSTNLGFGGHNAAIALRRYTRSESMDSKRLAEIADVMEDRGLTRVRVEEPDGTAVELERASAAQPVAVPMPMPSAMAAPVAAPTVAPAAPEPAAQTPAAAPEPKGTEVTAPMVGVFYAAPAPGDEPFVHVGSKVKAGETLCIIEAMKVLNEVTAEADGEVLEICVADGDLVEFGSCLMRIG